MATATLDLPVNLAVAALRAAGTGDNLLAALDALVTVDADEVEVADVTDADEVEVADETVALA
jgi:hypothetical protein